MTSNAARAEFTIFFATSADAAHWDVFKTDIEEAQKRRSKSVGLVSGKPRTKAESGIY